MNYFIGSEPAQWHTNVPTYDGVTYDSLYPGITLTYGGHDGQLKGTYVVTAHGDPSRMRWHYDGAVKVQVNQAGDLEVYVNTNQAADKGVIGSKETFTHVLTEKAPVAWQEINSQRVAVQVHYRVGDDGVIGFDLGSYDSAYPLTIDPTITYSSYFGRGGAEQGNAIAVDSSGNFYVAGSTTSTNFYTTTNAYQPSLAGGADAYVSKFSADGSTLLYSTYLGGGANDAAYGIYVDGSGDAYIAGESYSTNYPTVNAFQSVNHGGRDAIVTKLNATGSALVYSTYLGGSNDDGAEAIAVDDAGSAYVAGVVWEYFTNDFPTTSGAFQTSPGGGFWDGFVTKFSPSGSSLSYSSYLGGSDTDEAMGIAVGRDHTAYVTGKTGPGSFPVKLGAYQYTKPGNWDAFVTRFNAAGSDLIYSTYLGGASDENDCSYCAAIAIDGMGNAYVTGRTASTDFPHFNAFQPSKATGWDAYVTKLLSTGSDVAYSTFLGGNGDDFGYAITVDGTGRAYVGGSTASTDFPRQNASYGTYSGNSDAFLTLVSAFGPSLVYSTYLGGDGGEVVHGITLDRSGNYYVVGTTSSTTFPHINAFQSSYAGGNDAFLVKGNDLPSNPTNASYRGGGPQPLGNAPCTCVGQPVTTASGNFWHTFTDLAIPGRGFPLVFQRTYNSEASNQDGPLGYGWTHSYNWFVDREPNTNNYLVHEGNGSIVPFGPDFSSPNWIMATFTNTTDTTYVLTPSHTQDKYYFQPLTSTNVLWLYQLVDRNGYTTTLSYDATSHLLTTVTDPANRTLTLHYDPVRTSLLTSVTDDTGNRSVSFQYETGINELRSATDVGNQSTSFSYETVNGYHRLLTMTDPNNGLLTNVYDSSNRVTSQTDPMTRTIQLGYFDFGNNQTQARITDTLGLVTTYDYSFNVLNRVISGAGTQQPVTTTYGYWPNSTNVASETDALGHTWNYTWDTNGNLLSSTDPLTRTVLYAYNSTNDPTTITNTVGLTTSFQYDQWGNVTTITRPVTETNSLITTTLSYDSVKHGDLIAVTNPLTHSWGISYDTYGYVLTSTNPLQQSTSYTHNSIGWLTQVTDPMTYSATVSYNPYGEPLIITDTRHFTTTYSYDNVGNLMHVTDANFRAITNTYNLDNELTRATRPDGTHSDYEYDNAGRVITQTNGLGQSTKYQYDDINRIVTVTDPLTRSQSYAYDLVGNTSIITDARGLTTTYGYDNAYQLLNITYHDSGTTPNVSYTYNKKGLRDTMTDGTGTSYYIYDSLNRLKSYQNGAGATVGYGYDNASRITSITYPGTPHTVTRGYDDANRLTSVTDWLSPSHTTNFSYNADGAVITQTYPNSTQLLIGRDAAQEVVAMTHTYTPTSTTLRSFTYSHDPVGVITSTVDSPTGSHTYSYDPLYRLVGDQIPGFSGSNRTYQYDAATEIYSTSYTQGGISGTTITTTRGYDAADELKTLLERTNGATSRDLTFTYDNNGNRTYQYDTVSNKHNNYTYDSENRLTRGVYGVAGKVLSSPWSYTYNGDGLRMGKSQFQTSTQKYTWDINEGLPLLLVDENVGVATSYFIYGPGGEVVEQIDGSGNAYYYHPDQLGSIRAVTNSSGNVVNSYNYDPYGNRLSSTIETVYNPFGYTGEYTDAESGFVYLRARYYDPSTQQFLSVDPIVGWTEQAYAYTGASPLNRVDPSGLHYDERYWGDAPFYSDCGWACTQARVEAQFDHAYNNAAIINSNTGRAIADAVGEELEAIRKGVEVCNAFWSGSLSPGSGIGLSPDGTTLNTSFDAKKLPKFDQNFDPTKPPTPDFEWKGPGQPGDPQGNWFNPKTGESLWADANHPPPEAPHWDYRYRGMPKGISKIKIYEDGSIRVIK